MMMGEDDDASLLLFVLFLLHHCWILSVFASSIIKSSLIQNSKQILKIRTTPIRMTVMIQLNVRC
jgi:hypothetical protein